MKQNLLINLFFFFGGEFCLVEDVNADVFLRTTKSRALESPRGGQTGANGAGRRQV